MPVAKRIFTRSIIVERLYLGAREPAATPVYCSECTDLAEMYEISVVCTNARMPVRRLLAACEAGRVHFVETELFELLVCTKSLNGFLKEF